MLTLEKKDTYQVLGIDISSYSKDDFYLLVEERLKDNDEASPPLFVVTVNPEIAIQSIVDSDFRRILKTSSVNTADGVGISWAINYLYDKHIDRITGSDSLELICGYCAKYEQSVFLYGAEPGIAQKAADILCQRVQGLKVEGVYSPDQPDLRFEELPIDVRDSMRKASVIFVALGAPSQEKWIHENLPRLTGCKLIIGIGGSFDFIAGSAKRAPLVFRKSGLEWMYRLFQEPSRWRRMLRLPLFALNVILLKASNTTVREPGMISQRKEELV